MIFSEPYRVSGAALFIFVYAFVGMDYSPINNFFMADTFYYLILQS